MIDAAKLEQLLTCIAQHGNVARALRDCGVPSGTFYDALHADADDLRGRYARAKELGLEGLANEMLELADNTLIGTKTKETKDGTFDETGDNVDRSKLQIDTRKWLLARLLPKKYGDRLVHAGDDENPIAFADLTDVKADLLRRFAATTAAAGTPSVDREPE